MQSPFLPASAIDAGTQYATLFTVYERHYRQYQTYLQQIQRLQQTRLELQQHLVTRSHTRALLPPAAADQMCGFGKLIEGICQANCSHTYCFLCASKLINSSLSLLNEVPRCGLCDKVFNIARCPRLNESLLPKYQTKQSDLEFFRMDQLLLLGFIREILPNCIFPRELTELIQDCYKLVYFSVLECAACESTGCVSRECTTACSWPIATTVKVYLHVPSATNNTTLDVSSVTERA